MDVDRIRKDFPIFNNIKQPFVYLDNSATTHKPEVVISRLSQYYAYENANIHRGSYPLSNQASKMYESARETVRNWIDAKYSNEIVFTKSCTEAVNLVAAAAFETWIHAKDNVIVTELEHSSNYFPWRHYCKKNNVELRVAIAQKDGSLRADSVLSLIDEHTKFIAVTAMSNVNGFRPDLKKIIMEAHKAKIPVLVDATQEIAHQVISVQDMKCDFLCFSGHKIYGPMGTGVLYGKKEHLENMPPYLYGGDMVTKGMGGEILYKKTSEKYEAGTQNIGGILGLEAALLYLKERNFENLIQYETELALYLKKRMEALKDINIIAPDTVSTVFGFEVKGFSSYDIGVLLANAGIAIRCGSHCAYPLMKRIGKESICRVSLAFYNTKKEIDYFVDNLKYICRRDSRWKSAR